MLIVWLADVPSNYISRDVISSVTNIYVLYHCNTRCFVWWISTDMSQIGQALTHFYFYYTL